MSVITIVLFFVFALLGVPLAFAMAAGVFGAMYSNGVSPAFAAAKMVHSVDSFPLIAIPLFTMAGQLLIRGGVIDPLIHFANTLIGRIKGGLGHVTVLSAMGLSAVSGTAVADAAALGGILGPSLTKHYSRGFGAALVSAASCMGPIIPPSSAMILYAVVTPGVSVAGLFAAGVVPGIFMGLCLMVLCSFIAHRRGWGYTGDPFSLARMLDGLHKAWLILLMPIIVIGGIMAGVFTATEGAAVAVVYALAAGFLVTRKLRFADIPPALVSAAMITAVVGVLIAFSSGITFLFTLERAGEAVASVMEANISSQLSFLLVSAFILFLLGMFVEGNSLIIMLGPLLAPVAASFGVDPVYFAFLFIMNLAIGSLTPPVGILLFVTSSIWKVDIAVVTRNAWPFIGVLYGSLVMMIFIPELVMALPRWLELVP